MNREDEICLTLQGLINGIDYETGEVFEEMMYDHDTLEYKKVYRENGTLADRKGWLDNKIIERIAR